MSSLRLVRRKRVGAGASDKVLKTMMELSGKQVEDIACAVDREQSTVYRWLRGENTMSVDDLVTSAAECGCQVVVEITHQSY